MKYPFVPENSLLWSVSPLYIYVPKKRSKQHVKCFVSEDDPFDDKDISGVVVSIHSGGAICDGCEYTT